jgi:hypothetical protein
MNGWRTPGNPPVNPEHLRSPWLVVQGGGGILKRDGEG